MSGQTQPGESDNWTLIAVTIDLQRDVERALRLAANVLRGPDPRLRAEAIDKLYLLADEMADSTARLEEISG